MGHPCRLQSSTFDEQPRGVNLYTLLYMFRIISSINNVTILFYIQISYCEKLIVQKITMLFKVSSIAPFRLIE